MTKFRPYLYGRKFDIYTDHKPLVYLHNSVKPELRAHNLKTKLIGYDFNIIHIPGEKNKIADFLSRSVKDGEEDMEKPRLELYELADRQLELSSDSSTSSAVSIRALRTRRRKKAKKSQPEMQVTESESETDSDNYPRKKKHAYATDNSIITRNKSNEKLKNLANEGKMRENVIAASTPRNEHGDQDNITVIKDVPPPVRKRGRPAKIKSSFEAKIPPRYRGMHYKYAPMSPLKESNEQSNFWHTLDTGKSTKIEEKSYENKSVENKKDSEAIYNKNEVPEESVISLNNTLLKSILESKNVPIKKKFILDMEEKRIEGAPGLKIMVYESNDHGDNQDACVMDKNCAKDFFLTETDKNSTIVELSDTETLYEENTEYMNNSIMLDRFIKYIGANECSEKVKKFERITNIDNNGDCLFESLLVLTNSKMSVRELKNKLLKIPALEKCADINKARYILSTDKEWGAADIIYIYAQTYKVKVCVHLHALDRVHFTHYVTEGEHMNSYIYT